MIITRKKAIDIVANPATSSVIPELHRVYESYKQQYNEILRTKCSKCRASKNLNSVGDDAINVILSLSPEKISKLKEILRTTETLYVYVSNPAGVKMIELGK